MSKDQDKQFEEESVLDADPETRGESPEESQPDASSPAQEPAPESEEADSQPAAPSMRVMTGIVSDHDGAQASAGEKTKDAADQKDLIDGLKDAVEEDSQKDSADPFDGETEGEDAPSVEEVAARDEKSSTAPAALRSSVSIALEQRPPRRAKLNDGPRSRMLAELIPEVIIPTNSLETRGFSRIIVTEGGGSQSQVDSSLGLNDAANGDDASEGSADLSLEELINKIDGKDDGASNPVDPSSTGVMDAVKRPSVGKRKKGFKPPKMTPFKIVALVVALVAIITLALGGLFAWDRWYRYDDAQDVLGEWKMANAERTMVIAPAIMKIDTDINYKYTLDTKEKTITYSFGDSQGTASYRFSPDRQTLIIDESGDVDWLVALHLKDDPVLDDRDVPKGVTKLVKISDNTDAEPQNTEEIIDEDEDYWYEGTFINGYNEFKKPKLKDSDSDKKKKSAEGADADDDSDEDEIDDGAAYVDKETGTRYYFDSSQVLYYDQYGNYYYDMYGNNPYEPYVE